MPLSSRRRGIRRASTKSKVGRVEGLEGWKDGRVEGLEGWKDGRMEGWKDWKDGRMEGWKGGRVEGWKGGRMEGWKDGRMDPGHPAVIDLEGCSPLQLREKSIARSSSAAPSRSRSKL